ncbi:MAG: magnesium-translocating P-type ATPase [Nanoarchaeota archaeon]
MVEEKSLEEVKDYWSLSSLEVLRKLNTSPDGLAEKEVEERQKEFGLNELKKKRLNVLAIFLRQFKSPFIIILVVTSIIAGLLGELTDSLIICIMILISASLGFVNEYQAEKIVDHLTRRISFRSTVIREGVKRKLDNRFIVPGDIIFLSEGDVVPADLRIIRADGLECDESVLTGESLPVQKTVEALQNAEGTLTEMRNCAFMGTKVSGGSGMGVVIRTGMKTVYGKIAQSVSHPHPETAFQKGIRKFGQLLMRIILILTAFTFLINVLFKYDIITSLLFSIAIAIGLTPELLPVIMTVSLARGAKKLSQKDVLVKRLIAIEDLGNMDVLCTDKTGTLTEGKIKLITHFDVNMKIDDDVLKYALLCNAAIVSNEITGNPIDVAIWQHAQNNQIKALGEFRKLKEFGFDYSRRRMSTVIEKDQRTFIVSKGAPEAILEICANVKSNKKTYPIKKYARHIEGQFLALSKNGYRVIAVAVKDLKGKQAYTQMEDMESRMTFVGFITFMDSPKEDAKEAIAHLKRLHVDLKILTGDNELVTMKICRDLGFPADRYVLGKEIAQMSEDALKRTVQEVSIFARITPEQKLRIVKALKQNGHIVGFMGDGINDVGALHGADVGISIDTAVDVAKDAADIILLKKSLNVISDGVLQGRKTFGNTMKYILMGTSSSFGNMFSVAGASLVLNFLPMQPTQILLNNVLYDVSELGISTDNVDEDYVKKPKKWDMKFIQKFMLFFGPISSFYDFITFGVMLYIFHASASMFQTGWFIESLTTQVLVVYMIRTNKVPFFKSRPGKMLLFTTVFALCIGLFFTFGALGRLFDFTPLPLLFFFVLCIMVVTYLLIVELAKKYFFKRHLL